MLSIKGMYDGNIIVPLARINKKANTLVIITFLEEDLPTDEINLIKDVEEKFQTLSNTYAVGTTPDAESAKDMVTASYESITIPLDTATAQIFEESSAENKRKARLLLGLCLRELVTSERPLNAIMDEISKKAAARGLTPAILESLLHVN